MNIVMIDNYDSFTYNLVYIIQEIVGKKITVLRNDQFELEDLEQYDTIFLSPGPGVPSEAGHLLAVIRKYHKTKNIFGICLGMQAIGEVFGSDLQLLEKVYHGMATPIASIRECVLYQELPLNFEVGRYHSWVVKAITEEQAIEVTAIDEGGQIMSLQHKEYNVQGVQYHPESVLTPLGKQIIQNFIKTCLA